MKIGIAYSQFDWLVLSEGEYLNKWTAAIARRWPQASLAMVDLAAQFLKWNLLLNIQDKSIPV